MNCKTNLGKMTSENKRKYSIKDFTEAGQKRMVMVLLLNTF